MRFMIMHKNDANTEAGNPPSMEIVNTMGAFMPVTPWEAPLERMVARARADQEESDRFTDWEPRE